MKTSKFSAPGTMAEIKQNADRSAKPTDVLMRTGVKTLKTGPNRGKMMGLLQGVSDHGPKTLRNILMGRAPATKEDIRSVLKTQNMSDDDIDTVLKAIKSDTKGRFTVKALNDAKDELNKTKMSTHSESNGKILVEKGDSIQTANFVYDFTVKNPIEDYDQSKKLEKKDSN